ncbi:MAG TPA: hypothetical protein VMD30_08035, partial [Tepidisphaeraceae bacterium]|nr:hypothetical protein [Tepidisphaeraceae bacterium]
TVPRRVLGVTAIVAAMILLFYYFDPRHPITGTTATSYEGIAVRDVARLPEHWRTTIADHLSDLLGSSAARAVFGTPLGNFYLNAGFGLVILIAGIASWRTRPLWGMWVAATILKSLVLYSDVRYLVPILPLLIFGWWRVLLRLPADGSPGAWRWSAPLRNAAFLLLLGATFITNAAASGRIVIQQHLKPFIAHYRDGHLLSLTRMAGDLTRLTDSRDIVLAPAKTSRMLTFLSDRIVIEPGHSALDPGKGRIFVIEMENPSDPQMGPWLNDLHVIAIGQPLAIEANPPRQGGRLALYVARITGVPIHKRSGSQP